MSAQKTELIPVERIRAAIILLRGQKVMLDRDLAELYGVETKALKRAVKRNADRFPEDFMFVLSPEEFTEWRSQFVTSKRETRGPERKSEIIVDMVSPMAYVDNNTRAVPLARKGDAHQGRVFYCPPTPIPVEEAA